MLIEPRLSPFYRWITIFPLALGVLLYIVTEGILDILKAQKDKIINNQTTKRGPYTKSEILEENVKWKDIQIGDILYLTKGEIVPADLILLDSGMVADKEALCMLDTQYYDGKSTLTAKRSSSLTQRTVSCPISPSSRAQDAPERPVCLLSKNSHWKTRVRGPERLD